MTARTTPRRILIVLPDPPLPFGKAASRWFYVLVRGLVERGHQVSTFAISRSAADENEARTLFLADSYDLRLYREPGPSGSLLGKCRSILRPYSYTYSPELRRDLNAELSQGFDVLHLEQLWSGYLGLQHTSRTLLHIHYLYSIDYSASRPKGVHESILRRRTLQIEPALLRRYRWITTLTPRLTDAVQSSTRSSTVRTVPFAMDLDRYPFDPAVPPERAPTVGLIGSFNWIPSHSAGVRLLERLWPEIKRQVPEARLQIVGRKASSALGDRVNGPDITVAEDVPDTIPYFQATDVLLYAPSEGSGMKVKILESMALGIPVVTTKDGVEGLPAIDGLHAGVSDDDAGLIERTVQLLRDPGRRQTQRLEARRLLERHCSPEPVLDALEDVYDSMGSRGG